MGDAPAPIATTFQSHHGMLLNAAFGGGPQGEAHDGIPLGLLSAHAPAAGPDESFFVEEVAEGQIALRTHKGYLVTAEGGGGGLLIANRAYDRPGPWETFTYTVIDDAGGAVALQTHSGHYVTAEIDGSVTATRTYGEAGPGPWETWITSFAWWVTPEPPQPDGGEEALANREPAGPTRLEHRVCVDDNGQYLAWGPSFFWVLRAYRDYRDRYEANLAWAAGAGATYYRGFATVGGWPEPDGWRDAGAFWEWARELLPIVLDDAFTRYRLRCSLTLFDGEVQFPSDAEQDAYVREVCDILRPRLHTVQDVQIANEYGPCKWDYPEGIERLRRHARTVREQLGPVVPIALTSRNTVMDSGASPDDIYAECHRLFDGLLPDIVTMSCNHDSRDCGKVCGPWRPVRQSWERVVHDEQGRQLEPDASINDEPIGPRSSVEAEEDPARLVDNCLTSWISGRSQYTYHTDAGIWSNLLNPPQRGMGEFELIEHHAASPLVAQTLRALMPLIPPDLPSWRRTRHGLTDHPFAASFQAGTTPSGGEGYTQCWPDGLTAHGVVRFYLAYRESDWRFVGTLMGIADRIELKWLEPLEFKLYACATGELLETITTDGGGQLVVPAHWDTDIAVIGNWR